MFASELKIGDRVRLETGEYAEVSGTLDRVRNAIELSSELNAFHGMCHVWHIWCKVEGDEEIPLQFTNDELEAMLDHPCRSLRQHSTVN